MANRPLTMLVTRLIYKNVSTHGCPERMGCVVKSKEGIRRMKAVLVTTML
jgi:hypothetical protein